MKQAKALTRNQKEIVRNNNLNWKEWSLSDDTGSYLVIVHKTTGQRKIVDKYRKAR